MGPDLQMGQIHAILFSSNYNFTSSDDMSVLWLRGIVAMFLCDTVGCWRVFGQDKVYQIVATLRSFAGWTWNMQ